MTSRLVKDGLEWLTAILLWIELRLRGAADILNAWAKACWTRALQLSVNDFKKSRANRRAEDMER